MPEGQVSFFIVICQLLQVVRNSENENALFRAFPITLLIFKASVYSGCQTFHTLPTRSGPGFSVGLPGSHPAGQASAPLVFLTC